MIQAISAVWQSSIDRVVAFIVGSDSTTGGNSQLYYAYATGTGGWSWGTGLPGLPPVPAGSSIEYTLAYPSAVYQSSIDQVMAFVCDWTYGNLFRAYWNGSAWEWDGPLNPPGLTVGTTDGAFPVSAIYSPSSDQVLAFVVGLDGNLYLNWNYSSSNWVSLLRPPSGYSILNSLPFNSSLVAIYQPIFDAIWVFVVDDHGILNFATSSAASATNASSWTWGTLGALSGTSIVGVPAVFSLSVIGSVEVFVQGSDGNLYQSSNLGGPFWTSWENHGAPSGAKVSGTEMGAISTITTHAHIFVQCNDGKLYDRYFNLKEWTWDVHTPPPGNPAFGSALTAVYQPSIDRAIGLVESNDTLGPPGTGDVNGSLYVFFTVLRWRWDDVGSPF